ncbi:unnamed protein product [Prorocentrum cordatum]|uniref:Uncharacterized protein n=1 Tax=Prorocentrum cordatum TaxID=2364126 RepID=A0ABN9RZI6_9DINO|nr:unnamed protein product [Polarella glacialis]
MGSRAGGNSALELKHHVLNGRLAQAKKLLASTRISLEDCQDEDGNTALHWCAQGLQTDAETREVPDEEMLIFLLQNGAPKNRQNRIGETPLMGAVRMATLDPLRAEALISALLSKGHADPRRADVSGESPLMEAAAAGLEEVGRLLLEHRKKLKSKKKKTTYYTKKASPRAPRQPAGGELLRADGRAAGAGVRLRGLRAPAEVAPRRENARALASYVLVQAVLVAVAAFPCGSPGQEVCLEEALGRSEEHLQGHRERRREGEAKQLEQTLFGQRLRPGLSCDRGRPGHPYAEYQTLHDID